MDSTKRFSDRVENYVLYRPGYPAEIIKYLQNNFRLSVDKVIADVGAGTGISTRLFLEKGYQVFAVEPNESMLAKAKELLSGFDRFTAVNGTAENTTLANKCVDAIVAGQAFHWFDAVKCKIEFARILKPGGMIILIWNERSTKSLFEKEYDALIEKHARDYVKVNHRNIDPGDIAAFFSPLPMQMKIFDNVQVFDFNGLKGRLLSSSYMPLPNETGFDEMIIALSALFNKYERNSTIQIHYDTKVYTT